VRGTGTDTGIRLALVDSKEWSEATDATGAGARVVRRETWTITGGEIDPSWLPRARGAGWEPGSRFTLYVIDGEVDPCLASYGGEVWPTAWPALFQAAHRADRATIEITDLGLEFRAAALYGASDTYADVRLLP
jgi:hypothetical protein